MLFCQCLLTIFAVPLIFSTSVQQIFGAPKFAALLVCSSAIFLLLLVCARNRKADNSLSAFFLPAM